MAATRRVDDWHRAADPAIERVMRFLITLGWMVVAVLLALFSYRNWRDVTVDLWGPLQADIKLPILLLTLFLLGFVPLWLIMRGKVWGLQRRLLIAERPALGTPLPEQSPMDENEAQPQ